MLETNLQNQQNGIFKRREELFTVKLKLCVTSTVLDHLNHLINVNSSFV